MVAKVLSGGGGALPARRTGYACVPTGDWANAYSERAEIYEAVRQAGITGFATVKRSLLHVDQGMAT